MLGQRYHLITREDRLDGLAKDIVHHFLNRGYQGKAMVVSIDKLTTLRMDEKVRAGWCEEAVLSGESGLLYRLPKVFAETKSIEERRTPIRRSP